MLLASIHDIAPPHLAAARRLRDELERWGVGRATLLAVPNFHGEHPLGRCPETVRWLRARAAAGDEICLHGHLHRQGASIARPLDRLRAGLFTAREGECLSLSAEARRQMLDDERRRLEDLIGVAVRGFVAPAWLEPAGFAAHLEEAGFAWHEGSLWIERLAGRRRRVRTPVIGFATRSRPRLLASLAWAALLAPALAAQRARPVRVALHPADAGSPAVMRAAARAARALARRRAPATTAGALGLA